jgi:hypothetical protein
VIIFFPPSGCDSEFWSTAVREHQLLDKFDLLVSQRASAPGWTKIRKGVPSSTLMDDLRQRTMQGRKAIGPEGIIPFPLEVPTADWHKP